MRLNTFILNNTSINENFETLDPIKNTIMSINEVSSVFTEIFLGLSILYLTLYGVLTSTSKTFNYPLIQKSIINLSILCLLFGFILLKNTLVFSENVSFFNSTIVLDNLGIYLKQYILIISLLSFIIILPYLYKQKINSFEYTLLIFFSIFGVLLICFSNDLITAYLAIEVQSLAFYLLATFQKNSVFSTEAGLKYFILGTFSSSLFLFGFSFVYGITGSTNFDDFRDLFIFINSKNTDSVNIINKSSQFFELKMLQFGLSFILISLFFKLALAPFHIWSPDVYEGSPTSSTFFFALTPKIGIFILLTRLFQYSFFSILENWRYYFVFIALLSIIIGSFTGLEQRKMKSLLAYSSISHMGYLLLAFSTITFEGLQALFFYLLVYILTGFCVWSIFLSLSKKNIPYYFKKNNKDLSDLTLLSKSNKMLALFFMIALFSMAGFPPLIGFYAKMNIFLSVIEATLYFAALIGIVCSVISTFYYIRIIKVMYFEKKIAGNLYYPITYYNSIIISICAFLFIFLFINPNLIYLICYKMLLTSIY